MQESQGKQKGRYVMGFFRHQQKATKKAEESESGHVVTSKEIYLAGGCFWGTEKYFSVVKGVLATEAGYANGTGDQITYAEVCQSSGHAETVKVSYDPQKIRLQFLLQLFYEVIDPVAKNRQGNDFGIQYRSGIYYTDAADREIILTSLQELQKRYTEPLAIEVQPLQNYCPAETYHQGYLTKNPGGYCHIRKEKFSQAEKAEDPLLSYQPPEQEKLKNQLTELQYQVTQNQATEPAFQNEYYNHFRQGIYVDITTGEPLFSSDDKFASGCGWPSFSKPISKERIQELTDHKFGMQRVEVRSKGGNAHLGHVFFDGPAAAGGLRYCINSAALRFIAKDKMAEEGYGSLLALFWEDAKQ